MKLPASRLFKRSTTLIFFLIGLVLRPALLYAAPPQTTKTIDISYPNCDEVLPTDGNAYIIGVTGGKAFSHNPCLSEEAQQFVGKVTLYMNLNAAIGKTAFNGLLGPKVCKDTDANCQNFNYGFQAAKDAYSYASSEGVKASFWWFDIETANSWNDDVIANQQVVLGAKYFFTSKNIEIGVYSASSMWAEIMGNWQYAKLPVWIAPAMVDASSASGYCSAENSFTSGPIALVQYGLNGFDTNYACASGGEMQQLTQALR